MIADKYLFRSFFQLKNTFKINNVERGLFKGYVPKDSIVKFDINIGNKNPKHSPAPLIIQIQAQFYAKGTRKLFLITDIVLTVFSTTFSLSTFRVVDKEKFLWRSGFWKKLISIVQKWWIFTFIYLTL